MFAYATNTLQGNGIGSQAGIYKHAHIALPVAWLGEKLCKLEVEVGGGGPPPPYKLSTFFNERKSKQAYISHAPTLQDNAKCHK